MSAEPYTSGSMAPPLIRQVGGCPPIGLMTECDSMIEKLKTGCATTIEKQSLFDKLALCDCCWRHMDNRPSCCAHNHVVLSAIINNYYVTPCNCNCRHIMRLLADNSE